MPHVVKGGMNEGGSVRSPRKRRRHPHAATTAGKKEVVALSGEYHVEGAVVVDVSDGYRLAVRGE